VHACTFTLQRSNQYLKEMVMCGKEVKVNHTSSVMLSHPYIAKENANDFSEMRCHHKDLLGIACTLEIMLRCAPVW